MSTLSEKISRRDFLRLAGATAAGLTLRLTRAQKQKQLPQTNGNQ